MSPYTVTKILANQLLPEEVTRIIALKRQGFTLRRIVRETGRDQESVSRLLRQVLPDEHFLIGGQPNVERDQKIAAAFGEQLRRRALPFGIIDDLAHQFKVSKATVRFALKRRGIDPIGEALKKRLLFLLEVERSLKEPFEETKSRLGVSKNTLCDYGSGGKWHFFKNVIPAKAGIQ